MRKLFALVVIMCCTIYAASLDAMFTSTALRRAAQSRAGSASVQKISPFVTGMQKRTFYTPESIKRFSELPKEMRIFSPVYGIAKKESGTLEKMYAVKSDNPAPAVKLVQSLFHQIGNQFVPSRHITSPVCALTSGILGLVIAAAEKNQLENPEARIYIKNEWRSEYEKIVTSKRSDGTVRSAKDVHKLMSEVDDKIDAELTIINNEYKNDKNSGRSILLAFFALKADLTSDHDMNHYLLGVNSFLTVMRNQKNPNLIVSVSPVDNVSPVSNLTFLDSLKLFMQSLSGYQKNYTQHEYNAFKAKAKEISKDETMNFASENFELALSAILNEKTNVSLYPLRVVRSKYGYKEQHERSNCVETAFQDLFNIFLYNPETQLFDLSYVPTNLQLNEAFKKFYEDYKDPNQSSNRLAGQAFMNMVSNIDGVDYYGKKNYELNADPDNFLKVTNHLFGTKAQNLTELGALLSDQRRTITFTLNTPDKEGITKINMLIKDNKTSKELRADLGFKPGHGEISVAEREGVTKISLLDPNVLAKNYRISPEAQALFSIQVPSNFGGTNLPASFYYTLNSDGDWNKTYIIEGILKAKNPDEESIDYALHLYKSLDFMAAMDVVSEIIQSGTWRTFPKLKNLLVNLKNEMINRDSSVDNEKIIESFLANIRVDTDFKEDIDVDPEFVNYAFSLYQQLSSEGKKNIIAKMMLALLRSGVWLSDEDMRIFVIKNIDRAIEMAIRSDILDADLTIKLYKNSGIISQQKFLADILSSFKACKGRAHNTAEVISITKKLIDLGVDINGLSETGITPLVAAVFMENTQLVELLIENGALIDLMNKDDYKSTALFVAAQIGNDEIVNILLQHGADPNKECYFDPDVKSVPLVEAVMYSRDYLSTKLLLEYGANPTVEGRGGFLLSEIIAQMSKDYKPENFVDLFIKHGVDINHVGEYEITPLDLAYRRKSRPDSSEESDMIIKALKQAGAKTYRELKDVELKKQQLAAE